jgi:hypothetical protein
VAVVKAKKKDLSPRCCQWEKDNTLSVAGFPRLVKLSLVGNREGMARGDSSFTDHREQEGDIIALLLQFALFIQSHISYQN